MKNSVCGNCGKSHEHKQILGSPVIKVKFIGTENDNMISTLMNTCPHCGKFGTELPISFLEKNKFKYILLPESEE